MLHSSDFYASTRNNITPRFDQIKENPIQNVYDEPVSMLEILFPFRDRQ